MAPVNNIISCVRSLEENPRDIYLEVTGVLLTLAKNVIENPSNRKFRSVRLANSTIANKLVPAIGAMECLFEMGFEEADDSLVLPDQSSLHNLMLARDEILKRRKVVLNNDSAGTSGARSAETVAPSLQPPSASAKSAVPISQPDATSQSAAPKHSDSSKVPLVKEVNHRLIENVFKYSHSVQQYENESLQRAALACIPLAQLELGAQQRLRAVQKAIKNMDKSEQIPEPTGEEMLLLELMNWFKNSFFTWVDTLPCSYCSKETKAVRRDLSLEFSIDVFECKSCKRETFFPRYTDARKLLETRRGRCGEWANCFTLFCRSLRYETRLVLDVTDHIWTEVFLPSYDRWVHFDPCENAFDQPLMYELGWKKKLSYVIAFSHDDVQDVSWRYSCKHSELLRRRREVEESKLLDVLTQLREKLQAKVTPARKTYLQMRTLKELLELLKEPVADGSNYSGRQSGSLAWRLGRGEISSDKFSGPYVWKPNKMEIEKQLVHIQYTTSLDCYVRPAGGGERLKGWQNGAFLVENLFRKEEKDWKVAYLARTEDSEKGEIAWKLDLQQTGFVVDTITIALNKFTRENGSVFAQICGSSSCLLLGGSELTTDALSGDESLILKVQLSGGRGDAAWQYAQILRSALDSQDVTLDIKVKLKPRV